MEMFSDAQEQLTPWSVVESGRISSALLQEERNKEDTIKMKALECQPARFPPLLSDLAQNLMQLFPHPNDASDKIWLQLVH